MAGCLGGARCGERRPDDAGGSPRVQLGRKDGQPYYLYSHEQIDRRLEWMPDSFYSSLELTHQCTNEMRRDFM
jgi:hypothetical protein